MKETASMIPDRGARQPAAEEIAGLFTGAAFTFALFLGMAHFEHVEAVEPVAQFEDLRPLTIPFEPPPPTPRLDEAPPEPIDAPPLAGIEIARADSPVSIAVLPEDFEALIPAATDKPPRSIQFGALHAELKPKAEIEMDANHIFQETEVDQRPRVLSRKVPPLPPEATGKANALRVNLLLLIGLNGRAESVRIIETSGNAHFDAIIAQSVRESWLFSPAVRRGKKVRVFAQQGIRVSFSGEGSPFDL